MNTNNDFTFLKSKTEALGTALFYNFSNRILRFPTSLVQLSKFDEEGNVWFEIKKPFEEIGGMDRKFPAQLQFYKKNCTCYTTFHGIAFIITEEAKRGMVIIKFKIDNAECFYVNTKASCKLVKLKKTVTYFLKSFYRDEPNYVNIALNYRKSESWQ